MDVPNQFTPKKIAAIWAKSRRLNPKLQPQSLQYQSHAGISFDIFYTNFRIILEFISLFLFST